MGARGLCRERWVYVQRLWERGSCTLVLALVSFCLSNAVGPAWSSFFHSCSTVLVFVLLSALQICQWFPHCVKEQNKIRLHIPLVWSDPCLSVILHLLPPSSSPREFWSPGFFAFLKSTVFILDSELWNSSVSRNPAYFLSSTYHNLESSYFVCCIYLCFLKIA